MDWLQITPAFMSAIASVAAAVAAIVSLKISRRSALIAESTALASHHSSAALVYTNVSRRLCESTNEFSEFCYEMLVNWPRDIENKDNVENGGNNPRPLRHVLSNGSEMLAQVSYKNANRSGGNRIILSVIRNGLGAMTHKEYQELLKKVDGKYCDFEGILGAPSNSKPVTSAPAFRWVCYQLIKRVEPNDWITLWKDSWSSGGWLSEYKTQYLKIKPIFCEAKQRLSAEKEKLAHSVFPLERNKQLNEKYRNILLMLDCLIRDCDYELLDDFKEWRYSEESSQLVLCSLATANLARMRLDGLADEGFYVSE